MMVRRDDMDMQMDIETDMDTGTGTVHGKGSRMDVRTQGRARGVHVGSLRARMTTRRLGWLVLAMLAAALLIGPVARAATPAAVPSFGGAGAVDAGADADAREASSSSSSARGEGSGGRSFASAFFISRKLGGDGAAPRLELIGSAVIWLLLVLSMGSLGLIGQLAAANRRAMIMPAESFTTLREQLKAGQYREAISEAERDGSFFAQVLAAALREGSHGWEAMIHALDQRTDELVADRQRRIEILNVLGQVSPMIGLFGTVYGMILAFQSIVSAGGAADPVMLAGGIGTALTTTFWGLVVAIPALTGYAVVRAQMDARTAEAALAAEELIGLFRPRPRSNGRSGTDAGRGSKG
jgi:biopolymer transport protein ExbB